MSKRLMAVINEYRPADCLGLTLDTLADHVAWATIISTEDSDDLDENIDFDLGELGDLVRRKVQAVLNAARATRPELLLD